MPATKQHTTGGPRCPNHKCALLKTGSYTKQRRQAWQCPISTAIFDVEVDQNDGKSEVKVDVNGRAMISYTIEGSD